MALTKVSTDGVKDDAITSGKIPANAVGASELADNAVDTNAIANNAVTAGKTSGVQTTINNNADNRLITGSGSANTLNGETNATFTGTKLNLGAYDGGTDVNLSLRNTNSNGFGAYISGGSGTNYILRLDDKDQNAMFRFNANGKLGIGTGTPVGQLHLFQTSNDPYMYIQRDSGNTEATIGGIFWRNSTNNLGLIDVQSGDIDTGRMRFYVNKNGTLTESLKIDGNGNLEVLDASEARLQVKTPSNGIIALRADGVNTQLGTWSNHDLKLVRNTTEIASITANGITFGGDTAAANALDDFEEGTYTPQVIIGGGTSGVTQPTNRYGSYTKIGRRVFFNLWINGTVGYTGSIYHGLQITLPFTTNSSNAHYSALSVWFYAGVTDEHKVISRTENNDNKLILQYPGDSIAFLRVDGTWNMMISGQFDT
jgi:hypothetical protein